jgi:hypothetical protein
MEEEVGTRVKVQDMDEFAHVAWANRIERHAAAIPDTQGLLISNVRKAMPKLLWKVAGTTHTDWTSFCSAICKVTLTQIIEAKEEENKGGLYTPPPFLVDSDRIPIGHSDSTRTPIGLIHQPSVCKATVPVPVQSEWSPSNPRNS